MVHNEDSRVKIPAILHLTRLGYSYLSLNGAKWDEATNIFPDLFLSSIAAINPDAKPFAEISHIHADGHLETHEEAEIRMMSRYGAKEGDMFLSKIELLNPVTVLTKICMASQGRQSASNRKRRVVIRGMGRAGGTGTPS